MANDSFPSNDGEFDLFQAQFISAVAASPAKYGLLPQDVTALQADQGLWQKALAGHVKAQDDALTATQNKESSRQVRGFAAGYDAQGARQRGG